MWKEVLTLVDNFPAMYEELEDGFSQIGSKGTKAFSRLPEEVQTGWYSLVSNLDKTLGTLIGQIGEPTITVAGNMAKRIPSILVGMIVAFVSAYFFISEKEALNQWVKRVVPKPVASRMGMVADNLKYAVGGYFKAQFKIMAVVFVILLIGFALIGIHFSILLALGIAFLDFLPFFGTGTALIPWSVYKFLVGDYRTLAALVILYGVTRLVRQLIQPKLVGDSMQPESFIYAVSVVSGL